MDDQKLVDVRFDPNAEVIEKLLLEYEVVMFSCSLGSYTAYARKPNEKKSKVPDDRFTDDFTPTKALARLAYKVIFNQIVNWTDDDTPEAKS